MKRIVVSFAVIITLCVMFPAGVCATDEEILHQQMYESGAYQLEDALPEETADYMDSAGVDIDSLTSGEGVSISSFMEAIGDIFEDTSPQPIAATASILGIIVLSSLIGGLRSSASGTEKTASAVATIAIALVVMLPAASFIESAADTISQGCTFGAVFIPIFAAIMTAFGQGITAAGYSVFTLSVCELIMTAVSGVVIPMMRIFLSISTVSAIAPSIKMEGILDFFDKHSKWLLGLMAALLVGVLGVSSVAASAADNAGTRATRFVISSAVPVVGRAISDALGTVRGCLGILRSSAGSFGIIAQMFLFLPSIVQCILWILGMSFCSALAQMLEAGDVIRLLKSVTSVLSMVLALLIFVSVVLIASTAVVLGQRGAA